MNAAATIVTNDYIHYALALRESLIRFNDKIEFYILVTEKDTGLKEETEKIYPGTVILFGEDLCRDGMGKKIYDKYFDKFRHEFRWSMKPVLLKYLTEELHFNKALYLDWDLFFFNTYDFLFEKLDTSNVILTPHWRSANPHADPEHFGALFNHGLFNAGFIGVNKFASAALDWWAMVCEYICVKNTIKGFYDDQAHLNLLPILFDKVEILKHRGCNVAEWNLIECKRTKSAEGDILINNKYPIVFIHFTENTIKKIINGSDPLLENHLKEYAQTVLKYNNECNIIAAHGIPVSDDRIENAKPSIISRLLKKYT